MCVPTPNNKTITTQLKPCRRTCPKIQKNWQLAKPLKEWTPTAIFPNSRSHVGTGAKVQRLRFLC